MPQLNLVQAGFCDLFFPDGNSLTHEPGGEQDITELPYEYATTTKQNGQTESITIPMIILSIANIYLQSLSNSRDSILSLHSDEMGGVTKLGLVVVISLAASVGYTALNAAEVALRLLVGTISLVALPFFFFFKWFGSTVEHNFFMLSSAVGSTICAASFAGVVQGVCQVGAGFLAAYELMTNTGEHMPNAVELTDTASFGIPKKFFGMIYAYLNPPQEPRRKR